MLSWSVNLVADFPEQDLNQYLVYSLLPVAETAFQKGRIIVEIINSYAATLGF